MNLFFHHVGKIGADRDFPKTIFKKIIIDQLAADNVISDPELLYELRNKFPSGEFNCWGVPAGARVVIRNLAAGDYVFLVETAQFTGSVPILCPVKMFWPYELRNFSEYLWHDSKYSFIFFFDAIKIDLLWVQFLEDLGYKENFDPRGKFYKVRKGRLDGFGGVENYLSIVLNKRSEYKGEDVPSYVLNDDSENYGLPELQDEEEKLISLTKKAPQLTAEMLEKRLAKITKREKAFSILVKRHYEFKCSVCSLSIKSPDGYHALNAAHIFPKEKSGSDDIRNGICLCLLHHWAFDAGWFNLNDEYKVIVHKDIPRTKEYESIYMWEDHRINLPLEKRIWPHRIFLAASRAHYGFQ